MEREICLDTFKEERDHLSKWKKDDSRETTDELCSLSQDAYVKPSVGDHISTESDPYKNDKQEEEKRDVCEAKVSSKIDGEEDTATKKESTVFNSIKVKGQDLSVSTSDPSNLHSVQGIANLGATCWFNCTVPLFNAVRKKLCLPPLKIPILRNSLTEFFHKLFLDTPVDEQQDVLIAIETGISNFVPTKQQQQLFTAIFQETTCDNCNNLFSSKIKCSYLSL